MAKILSPVLKRCRTLGVSPAVMGYSKTSNKNPGGQRRAKKSEYALQLTEKQKVKFVYGILEKQFRMYYEKAARAEGNTGEVLLSLIERRLDNVIYRLGFAATRREARQLVNHGHFQVNGKKVNIPSYLLRAGDVVTIKQTSRDSEKIKATVEANASRPVPQWLDLDRENLQAKIVNLPERDQIAVPVEEHLIVEFYSK